MPEETLNGIRIYTRGKSERYYADFRPYADVGGGREALAPEGKKSATGNIELARELVMKRLGELKQKRFNRDHHGAIRPAELEAYAEHHLDRKAKTSGVRDATLAADENHLNTAVAFFGGTRTLQSIKVSDIDRYIAYLLDLPNGRGGTLAGSSVRKYLNSLSNLYRRAQAEERLPIGYNPVKAVMDKPSGRSARAKWLEIDQAALYLEAARLYEPARKELAIPFIHEIVATFLLTGARKQEVLALELFDVNLERKTITIWENDFRGRKTQNADRVITLWPQLEEILGPHLLRRATGGGTLLFPSQGADGTEQPIRDLRKALDAISATIGWKEGAVRTKMFRHTYCSARLQALDGGKPVSQYTVGKELGHGGDKLVNKVYAHLGTVRHRIEGLEYIADDHRATIGSQLNSLRAHHAVGGRTCKGVGFNDEPCANRIRAGGGDYCVWHDPAQAGKARKARAKHRKGTRKGVRNKR